MITKAFTTHVTFNKLIHLYYKTIAPLLHKLEIYAIKFNQLKEFLTLLRQLAIIT